MSRATKSAASSGRSFSRSTGKSIIDRLLSSGGKLAIVGLLSSLATLAFTLWIQALVRHQTEVGEPLARTSIELQTALARSFAELRSWVAFGNSQAPEARREVWLSQIEPKVEVLRQAAADHRDENVRKDVEELTAGLRRLKYLQWTVEDVAQTPSNRPAVAVYEAELRPILGTFSEYVGSESPAEVFALSKTFLETDRLLFEVLREHTPAQEAQVRRVAANLRTQTEGLEQTVSTMMPSDETQRLQTILREARAYERRIERALKLRAGPDANVSRLLFSTQLRPLQKSLEGIMARISERQIASVEKHGRGLFRLSFVVLGLSLLTGLLSIVSIYVSYRLEYRVQHALAQAKSLGQYEVGARIGGGAMGEVYEARHALLRRPSAIKILRSNNTLNPLAQERFRKEVQVTSRLNHPNTIAIFDYGRTPDGMFYYAMELLNGVALDILVDVTGPLTPARVIHVLSQVCSSLQEAHGKGLLHRDVKPSNIMLAEIGGIYDTAKVLDFGLVAQITGAGDDTGANLVGTPMYLAPEVILAPEAASPASDIYAIGAVGYFLLTGMVLFSSEDVSDVLRSQLEDVPVLPSLRLGAPVLEDLELIIMACLAKSPGERPESAAHLRAMLQEVSIDPWTLEDAEQWWTDYGEAIRAEARTRQDESRRSRSRTSVKVGTSTRA